MSEKYTINFYNSNGGLTESMYTDSKSIEIGSGLLCDIRIQLPSIEEIHVKIVLDSRELVVYGNGVSLNDDPLEINESFIFNYGDIFKIYDKGFSIELRDSNFSHTNKNLIKTCPLELCKEKNEIHYGRNQKVLDCADIIENPRVEYTSDDHDEVKEFIMRKNNVSELDYIPMGDSVVEGNNINKETNITTNVTSQCFIEDGVVVKEITEKINIIEYEEIEVVENVSEEHVTKTVEEINFHEEPKVEENIDEVKPENFSETVEKADSENHKVKDEEGNDLDTTKNQESADILMNHSEIQQAAKIIENGSNDVEIGKVISEGNLDTLKQAIHSKKEDIDEEIKESYENIATDTPINPLQSKKTVVDLGDAVIEKEILNEAEKIVDEKLQHEDKEKTVENEENDVLETELKEKKESEIYLQNQDVEIEAQDEGDDNKEEIVVDDEPADDGNSDKLADTEKEEVNIADEMELEDKKMDEKNNTDVDEKVDDDDVNQEENVENSILEDDEEIPIAKKKPAPKKTKAKPKPKPKAKNTRKPPVVISATPRPIRKAAVSAMMNISGIEDEPVKRVRRNASVIGSASETKRKPKGKK